MDIEGVTIHRIPNVPFIKKIAIGPSKRKIILDLYLFAKARKMLKKGNYDLLHTHEEAGFVGHYLAQKYNTLHLYDMHSSLPQQLANFKFSKSNFLVRLFEKLEAHTVKNSSAVITICPELFEYVEGNFPDKFNMLIENVADNSLVFKSEVNGSQIRQKIKTNGEAVVLYTGTFEAYQGIDLLIRASAKVVEQTKKVRFVLVGGKPEQVEHYKKTVADMQLDEYFVFTGSVLPQEIPGYIDNCDVLVSPRIEGNNTPLKIYSYLRSGKPIVATNLITHTQVLNDEVSVLTDSTPEAFGSGVLNILKEDDLRKRVTENAQKLAENRYSYEAYLKKTKEVFVYLEELENAG